MGCAGIVVRIRGTLIVCLHHQRFPQSAPLFFDMLSSSLLYFYKTNVCHHTGVFHQWHDRNHAQNQRCRLNSSHNLQNPNKLSPNKLARNRIISAIHMMCFLDTLFSQADHVRELLQGFVSDQYVSLMVLKELTPVDSVYTDTRLSQHESDMIFRVKLKEVYAQDGDKQAPDSVDIYLLFEHKSSPESSVVLQCLRYMVTRWEYDWANKIRPRASPSIRYELWLKPSFVI